MRSDEEFEAFLRAFRPVAPPPLRAAPRPASRMILLSAAVVLVAIGSRVWLAPSPSRPPQPVAQTAQDDREVSPLLVPEAWKTSSPERLDRILDRASRRALPDVGDPHGILRALGAITRDR
jgi:hypothetical protein